VTVRALAHVETAKGGRKNIVFTEFPPMVSPDRIAEHIAQHVKAGRLDAVADVRNESDQDGLRLVVEVKKGEDEQVLLNQLYKHTQLQERQSIISIAIVNNRPQTLGLKDLLLAYRNHRVEVIRRRTRYLLARAEERAHILEGLLVAVDHLDEVVRIIRRSKDADQAAARLRKQFALSEAQAKAILAMRLAQLTGLEREKLRQEYAHLQEQIENYRAILADEGLVLDIIREDLYDLKDKYGDERRTRIVGEVGDFNIEDLIADEMVAVVISHDGYIKRQPVSAYRKQRRGGKGITATGTKEGDYVEHLFIAATLDYILFFTDQGRVYWLKVYDIPEMGRAARGRAIVNLLEMRPRERITSQIPVRDFSSGDLLMATERGMVKKTRLEAYGRPKKGGIIAINLAKGDRLVDVALCLKEQDVVLATERGKAIRFKDSAVRPTGRATSGVRGIRLEKGDRVVGMVVGDPEATLLTVCENGYGKRTRLEDYRLTNRGGKGVIGRRRPPRRRHRRGDDGHRARHAHPHLHGGRPPHRTRHAGRATHRPEPRRPRPRHDPRARHHREELRRCQRRLDARRFPGAEAPTASSGRVVLGRSAPSALSKGRARSGGRVAHVGEILRRAGDQARVIEDGPKALRRAARPASRRARGARPRPSSEHPRAKDSVPGLPPATRSSTCSPAYRGLPGNARSPKPIPG